MNLHNEPQTSNENYYYSNGKRITLIVEPSVIAVRYRPGKNVMSTGLSKQASKLLKEDAENIDFFSNFGLQVYRLDQKVVGKDTLGGSMTESLNKEPIISYVSKAYLRSAKREHRTVDDLMFLDRQFIVKFKDYMRPDQIDDIVKTMQATVIEKVRYMTNGYVLEAPQIEGPQGSIQIANRMYEMEEVEIAHPNFIRRRRTRFNETDIRSSGSIARSATSYLNRQWHLDQTKAKDAWNTTKGSASIKVAILDDGVDTQHPEFTGKITDQFDFGAGISDGNPKSVQDRHGTACAGVAVGKGVKAAGSAPDCSLIAVRYPDALDFVKEANMFRWTADQGADIISCSWGPPDGTGNFDPLPDNVRAAIKYCVDKGRNGKGTPIFWAAGNGNELVSNDGYASNPDVMAVAANNEKETRSFYSDFGPEIFISAPSNGSKTLNMRGIFTVDRRGAFGYNPDPLDGSSHPIGDHDYTDDFGGTSSATPLVAGIAGLVLSVNSNLKWTDVKEILKKTADKIDTANGNYDATGHSNLYGYGRINALKAVQEAQVFAASGGASFPGTSPNTKPSILAPSIHSQDDGPPIFEVDLAGRNFYAIELATDSNLFNFNTHGNQRSDTNFFASWIDGTSTETPFQMPVDVWNTMKTANQIFYRLYVGSEVTSDGNWTDFFVSFQDSDSAFAPSIAISSNGVGSNNPPSTTSPATTSIVFPSGASFKVETNPSDGVDYSDHVGNGIVPLIKVDGRKNEHLSTNFMVKEFASKDISAKYARISKRLVSGLQNVRTKIGRSMTINSSYRNTSYNASVGGAARSQHIAGRAVDVKAHNTRPLDLARHIIEEFGCDIGIGLGRTIVHLDLRGSLSTWVYSGAELSGNEFRQWVNQTCVELGLNRSIRADISDRIRPIISGPETYHVSKEAPTFLLNCHLPGFYAVEIASDLHLLTMEGHSERTQDNFYGSWSDALIELKGETVYRIPDDVWSRLSQNPQLYYRVVITADGDRDWDEVVYSVPPTDVLDTPWIKLTGQKEVKDPANLVQSNYPGTLLRDEQLWRRS